MSMRWLSDILPQNVVSFIESAWQSFLGWMDACYDTLMDWRLLTSDRASIVLIAVAVFFFLPVIHMWLQNRGTVRGVVAAGFLTIPVAIVILLQTPTGFVGTPDDNCTAYERGKMTFSLLDAMVVPKKSSDIYGDAWLILYVQNARWGDDVHECRVSLSDPKVRVLTKAIHDARLDTGPDRRFSGGQFTFSFGGRNEVPNVRIKGLRTLEKPYPPERGRDTSPVIPPASPSPAPQQTDPVPQP